MPIHIFGNNYHDIEFLVISSHFKLENLMNRMCMLQKHDTLSFLISSGQLACTSTYLVYIYF